jgi:hypothetical protein
MDPVVFDHAEPVQSRGGVEAENDPSGTGESGGANEIEQVGLIDTHEVEATVRPDDATVVSPPARCGPSGTGISELGPRQDRGVAPQRERKAPGLAVEIHVESVLAHVDRRHPDLAGCG